jgi:hypothetical protein
MPSSPILVLLCWVRLPERSDTKMRLDSANPILAPLTSYHLQGPTKYGTEHRVRANIVTMIRLEYPLRHPHLTYFTKYFT